MSSLITRRPFTVVDYFHMVDAGILQEDDRVELIRGEVLAMSPIGPEHNAAVARANRALVNAVGEKAIVWIQNSTQLDDFSAPQPDIVLLKPKEDFYASRLPGPGDMLLIVEVADSSLRYDCKIKTELYAEAGISEYWIADIQNDCVFVYSRPDGKAYKATRRINRGEQLTPELLPDCGIQVDDLLP